MRSIVIIACTTAALALTGCATIMEQSATKELQAQCAEMGMQFVKKETKKTEAIVLSSASVSGECVGSTDPRWVEPASDAAD